MSTFDQLYNEFLNILDQGNEGKAKEFLLAHLEEFPPHVKENIVMAFFEDTLRESAAVASVQDEGLEMVKELEGRQASLEKQKKLLEIKETM